MILEVFFNLNDSDCKNWSSFLFLCELIHPSHLEERNLLTLVCHLENVLVLLTSKVFRMSKELAERLFGMLQEKLGT